MKCNSFYLLERLSKLVMFLAPILTSSGCTGENYIIPDYLRCSHINVASAFNGGKCVGASENSHSCSKVIDGQAVAGNSSYEWNAAETGVGSWVKIQFARKYLINTIRVMQRASAVEQNKGLRLEFSDGSEAFTELTKNEGDSMEEAVWDVRHFAEVDTNFVKVVVETVYSSSNNGFKEIEFYHDNCNRDNLCDRVSLPAGGKTELRPVFGKTISFLLNAGHDVSVALYDKPLGTSAGYRFSIGLTDGTSSISRTKAGVETLKTSKDTTNVLVAGQWRTVWIDFRSSDLTLGSGGEILLQWNDPSPIYLSYVTFTGNPAGPTDIILCNRLNKCYRDADHFWPLDKVIAGTVYDLLGHKHGTMSFWEFASGPVVENMRSSAIVINSTKKMTTDFGDFAGTCISDSVRCENGITVALWVKVRAGVSSVILGTAETANERGIAMFYDHVSSELRVKISSQHAVGQAKVAITARKWYHVVSIWKKGEEVRLLVNGVERFTGITTPETNFLDQHTHLLAGKSGEGGASNAVLTELVVWTKALEWQTIMEKFSCAGLQPQLGPCSSIEEGDRVLCGWVGIQSSDCQHIGCCYDNNTCFRRDGLSNSSKLGVGSGSSGLLSSSTSKEPDYPAFQGRLTWRWPNDSSWADHAWQPSTTADDQWLQVDLNQVKKITAVATQGYQSQSGSLYCKTYTLSYSGTGRTWEHYKENNTAREFNGNIDGNGVVKNDIKIPFDARFVRFHVKSWVIRPALKVEVYGFLTAVNYVGCYTRGPFEPAGDYAPDSLTPDLCTTRCGSAGAGFAVLRNGDQCLCSRSLEEDKKVGDARCNEPCKGNLAFNCGGFESFSAYRTLRNYTLAMAMTIPRNVSLFETVNTSFTSLAGATYTADFGENILVASSCPLVPYSFHTLGSHAVHAQISTGEYEGPLTLVATSQVDVYSSVGHLEHGCPPVVEANKVFECVLTVYKGSDMHIEAQFTGGSTVSSYMDDARSFAVGEVFSTPERGSLTNCGKTTVLIPSYRFEEDGRLAGWKTCTETGGYVSLQIFRPVCGDGVSNYYCYENGDCKSGVQRCTERNEVTCTSGQVFCTSTGICTDNNTSPTIIPDIVPNTSYELVMEYPVHVSGPGCHILQFNDKINKTFVKEGDIVGFTHPKNGSAKITSRRSERSRELNANALSYNNINVNLGSVLSTSGPSGPSSATQIQYSLAAIQLIPSIFLFPHNYPIGNYHEEVTAAGPWNEMKEELRITAIESISNVTWNVPNAVATNESFKLVIRPHKGYNITYVVKNGDGTTYTKFRDRSESDLNLSFDYNTSGVYKVSLVASNILSSAVKMCEIVVQDAIAGLAFYDPIPPLPIHNATKVKWLMRQGTGVNVSVDFGDGYSLHNGSFDVAFHFVAVYHHLYQATGEYLVRIDVSNCVSNATIQQVVVVERPLDQVDFVIVHANRDIEVNESVAAVVTLAQGTNPVFEIDFGDGSFVLTKEPAASHSYWRFSVYNVSISAFNNVSRINISKEIQVHKPVDPLIGFNVICHPTNFSHLSRCMLSIRVGSDFRCTWDWGDGIQSETVFQELGNFTYHNYSIVRQHHVSLNCSNRLNKTTASTIAIVEEPIMGFEVFAPVAKPFGVAFTVKWEIKTGTDVIFNVTFTHLHSGFSNDVPTNLSGSAHITDNMMPTIGVYVLEVTAVNYVTPLQTITLAVLVDIPISNPTLRSFGKFVEVHTTATFSCEMEDGSNVSLWWDFSDGSILSQFFVGQFSAEGETVEHVFEIPGTYTVNLIGNNSLGNFTRSILVYVQSPVKVELRSNSPQNIPPGIVTFNISVPPSEMHPTNSTYEVNYGDGASVTRQRFSPPLILHHVYPKHGSYQMNITIKNNVSFVVLKTDVEVQTPIADFKLFGHHTEPLEDKGKPGRGPQSIYFPCDHPVNFTTSIKSGTNISYTWDFGDGSLEVTSTNSLNHIYANPGRYFVAVLAENAVSREKKVLTIDMQWTVKLASIRNDGPATWKTPVRFGLDIERLGTNSCYVVYIGNSAVYTYKISTDPSFLCPEACLADSEQRTFSDERGFSFEHTCSTTGRFHVSVVGCNMVSIAKKNDEAACTPKPCKHPSVAMDETNVGKCTTNAKVYFRRKRFKVKTAIKIDCEATNQTKFLWEVSRYDNQSGTSSSYTVSKAIKLTRGTLMIPPRQLPYGLFKLKFTVTMKGVQGVYGSSYGFIRVVPSDIQAVISRGTSWAVGYGKTTTISASRSYDPDEEVNHPNDFQFCWFCARKGSPYNPAQISNCTSLPAYPLARDSAPRNRTNDRSYSNSSDSENGCFGYPLGRLNASASTITISTQGMAINGEYVFYVLVAKGKRVGTTHATIVVKHGATPDVVIGCVTNCGSILDPSNKLALSGKACESCPFVKPSYRWHVTYEISPGIWKDVPDVQGFLTTGLDANVLAVKPGVLMGGKKYTFRLESWIPPAKRRKGFAEYVRSVNKPPEGGSCDVTPKSGFALQSVFSIRCSGWTDENPLTYRVTARQSSGGTELLVAQTKTLPVGKDYEVTNTELPMGLPENFYVIDIFVSVYDAESSMSMVNFTAKVEKAKVSEQEQVDMLENKAAEVDRLLSEGDMEIVMKEVGNVAAALKAQPIGKNTQMNERLVKSLRKIEPNDPASAIQLSGTITAVVSDSQSDQAKDTALNAVADTASMLDSEDITTAEVKQLAANLLQCLSFVIPQQKSDGDENKDDPPAAVQNNDASIQNTAELAAKKEQLKKTSAVRNKIYNAIGGPLLPGEDPVFINGGNLNMTVEKTTKLKKASCGGSSMSNLGSAVDANSTEVFQIRAACMSGNPMSYAKEKVDSNIVELGLTDESGNPIKVVNRTQHMDLFIEAAQSKTKPRSHLVRKHEMVVLKLNVTNNKSAISVWAIPEETATKTMILCRKSRQPSLEKFDFRQVVPKEPGNSSDSLEPSPPESQRYQLFIGTDDMNGTVIGTWYCGFYYNGSAHEDDEENAPEKINLTITIFESTCKYFDNDAHEWRYDGCKSGPLTTPTKRHCRCNHLTSFASDVFVPPNKIDWEKISAEELLNNPLVFSVVLGIVGLYFLLVVWARRADRKDLEKVGVAPLPDNDPRDSYLYEVVVYTGFVSNAGTTSHVRMVLSGDLDETSARSLKDTDPGRRKFCRGNVDYFLLSVPRSLGKLKSLRIWHDNTGHDPSWYLHRIMVHDIQTDAKAWFICDRWLAVEEDDGCVDRTLIPATKDELTSFNLLFSTEARKKLTDGHLWFSVFTRPAKSNFTRVQRLSCCLSITLCTMLANAMFYEVNDQSSKGTSVHLGPFIFSVEQLSIGITSSLIVLPANVLIVTFFRKARAPVNKKSLPKDAHTQEQKSEVTVKAKEADKGTDNPNEDDNKKNKKKEKRTLPHYFVYIAYSLIFLCSTVSATFTIFYGLTFGKEKSASWLSAIMISFCQDVLISQPLKVFAAAMFFALVIKDPNKAEDENDRENNELSPDEEALHSKAQNSDEEKALRKIGFVDKPPNPEKLEAARQLRLKQKEMKDVIREIIQYFLFLGILLVVAYGNRDPMAFDVTRAMKAFFEKAKYTGLHSIDGVGDVRAYWSWVHDTYLPTLMPRVWYGPTDFSDSDRLEEEVTKSNVIIRMKRKKVTKTKTTIGNVHFENEVLFNYEKGFVADHTTAILVGTPRLRQLRVRKGQCKLLTSLARLYGAECNVAYDWDFEEERAHEQHWVPLMTNVSTEHLDPTPWIYQSQLQLQGTPYWGRFATYWGGGYVVDLGTDRKDAEDLCKTLDEQDWIDRYTRAIFAEFTIYNAQANLFGVVTLLSEILTTGGYHHQPAVQTIRLHRYVGPQMMFVMACEITYIACLLYFMYRQAKKYRNERSEYFKDGWSYPEILMLGFSLSAVGLYFARLAIANLSISKMHETPNKFVSFQYVAFMDEWVSSTTGLAVFFSFLKFLRLLKFNRRVSTLILTIKLAAAPLASFFLMFFILFLAYVQFAFIVFGIDNSDFASFSATLGSMLSLTLGSFDFDALRDSSRLLGPAFFFSYVVTVFFVVMNVFIGILSDALNEVASDSSKQDNEHEILDFMLHTLKRNIGKQVGPAIKPKYKKPKTPFELKLDSIEEISDNVQCALRNICIEDIRQTNWLKPENSSKKKRLLLMLLMETSEDFTEDEFCGSIPLFDELMAKNNESELVRKFIYYREKKKVQEEVSQEVDVDNKSEKSSEDSSDSHDDDDNDDDDDDDDEMPRLVRGK